MHCGTNHSEPDLDSVITAAPSATGDDVDALASRIDRE
jgi:hypothetical protein